LARMGDFTMSGKHFVAVAGLLTGLVIAPGDVEEVSYGRTEISGYGGSDLFGAVNGVLVVDSSEAVDVNGAGARSARSSPPEYNPVSGRYANIRPTTGSNILSDPPVVDPLFLRPTSDKGDSNTSGTVANASAHPSISTPTMRPSVSTPAVSLRALKPRSRAPSTLRPEGCAQCGGEVAHASAGRAKSLLALLSRIFSGNGGSVRPRHPVTGIGRERDGALLTASTIQHGRRDPSL